MLDAIKMEDLPSFKYGEEIGEKRGIEKRGIEKRGIEKGIEKGIEDGIKKEKLHIALNMLKSGINIKDISLFTELSIEEIKELKN